MKYSAKLSASSRPIEPGSGVIFYNSIKDSFLFFLRDNKSTIRYPNQLAIIGGQIEQGETAWQTLRRELAEELVVAETGEPLVPPNITLFKTFIDSENIEHHIHGCERDSYPDLSIKEGQGLVWLKRSELAKTDFAYHYKAVILQYAASVAPNNK